MRDLNWTPRPRPAPDVLQGRATRLERLDWSAHGDGLYEAICGDANDGLWAHIPIGPFADRQIFQQIFEFVRGQFEWETMVIREAASNAILGTASFMRLRPEHGSAEVGCVVFGAALKRTTFATEAMYLMADHVFNDLGYRRYEWKCHNENAASKAAALRFGFQFEGVFRNDMVMKGKNRDTAWFSIIDAEWSDLKLAYEGWLDPVNFDSQGKQVKKLEEFR